jgi:2-isopropylmalate synthase
VSKAIAPAAKKRIHVFLATSAIHRQFKLNMARDEIIRTAVEGVKIAREFCEDVEFSPGTRHVPNWISSRRWSRPSSRPAPPP